KGPAPAVVSLVDDGDPGRDIPACASCHMPESAAAPYLTSQHADYIAKQLRDFRSGERANDTTSRMTAIAKALDDREIDALAAYLASMPRTGSHDR
ncbi:MAG TPA: c-type cytochrome, partial [Hyphomicrobiales bacterium]|nr:c-type cytochrome [Hyphomicrobiales bacterium]